MSVLITAGVCRCLGDAGVFRVRNNTVTRPWHHRRKNMPPVEATLVFTPSDGPVELWVKFTCGDATVTVSAPMWRLEGERDGFPCSEHPPVVQAAVSKLAGLSADAASAAELFRIIVAAAQTIASLSLDDPAFVWPTLVERNTA